MNYPPPSLESCAARRRSAVGAGARAALACLGVFAALLIGSAVHAQQAGRPGTTYYPSSTEIGAATVTYDEETRKLIVVADEETAAYVSQVVTNLDRPAPQVLIKVVFLEVTYRDGLDLGIEGAYIKDMGNSTTGSIRQVFGLGNVFSTPPGAGLYQIMSDDYQVTLRAIAEAGKTEVLSRPSVLARNNQEAVITVAQQVPLITGVRYDNFGNQINAVEYQPVGIILRVTPFITSDGMVEMIVSPEISNLSDQTVPIAAGVEAPVINTRSADTVVITPDGQTVVIGGLMSNLKTQADSKIPWLGDIPLLGNLFKRKSRSGSKTELLIFLTPRIVTNRGDLLAMTARERAQQELAPKSFSEDELNRFLSDIPRPQEKSARRSKRRNSN
jgi:general secretion pathway protein D